MFAVPVRWVGAQAKAEKKRGGGNTVTVFTAVTVQDPNTRSIFVRNSPHPPFPSKNALSCWPLGEKLSMFFFARPPPPEARALTLEGCSSSEVLLVFQHWKDRGENEKEKRENKYESSLRKRTSPAQPIRQSHNSVATGFFFELLVATRVFLVFKRPTGTDRSGSYRRPGGPGVGSPALVKNRENTHKVEETQSTTGKTHFMENFFFWFF